MLTVTPDEAERHVTMRPFPLAFFVVFAVLAMATCELRVAAERWAR
jgi:hypothetical protein